MTNTADRSSTLLWVVRVRDIYTGLKGEFVEQVECTGEVEAKKWAKQFRGEYEAECGYRVTCKQMTWAEAYPA